MAIIKYNDFMADCHTTEEYAKKLQGYIHFHLTGFDPSKQYAGFVGDVIHQRGAKGYKRFYIKDPIDIMAVKICMDHQHSYEEWYNRHRDKPIECISGSFSGNIGCGDIAVIPKHRRRKTGKLNIPKYNRQFTLRRDNDGGYYIRKKIITPGYTDHTEYHRYDINDNRVGQTIMNGLSNIPWDYVE